MAINTVPEKLNDFRVYLDGSNDLRGVADITLPSFEMLSNTVSGAGIAGEYDSPVLGHMKSLKLALNNWRTISQDLFLLLRQQALKLDCRGAFQEYDSAAGTYVMRNVKVFVQGLPMKVDLGKMEKGATSAGTAEVEVVYIKVDIDGVTVVEVDKFNYKCLINGFDYLAQVRTALGL